MIPWPMSQTETSPEVVAGVPAPQPAPVATADASAPAVAGATSGARAVWAIRDFRIVAAGQGISAIGDAVSFTALPLLVLALTGSGTAMGIVAALQTLPDLVLGLPAGAYADRWDRRRMMLYADLGRALLTATIPLSVVLGVPTMGVILAVVFPINALRVVFMAAWTGAVPNLVGRALIGPASSYFEAIFALGFILGPGIAGLLASVIGPGPTLAVDAASFVASATALWFVRTPLRSPDGQRADSHIATEIRDGIRFVIGHGTLRAAIAFWGAVSIGTAGLIPALAYFITVDRRLEPSAFGLVISAYSLGSLGGALLAARLVHGRLGPLMLVGNGVTGALLIVLTGASVPIMAALALVTGIANMVVGVSYITVRASSTPDALLGRVGATARMVSVGLQPIGAAGAGFLLDAVSGTTTMRLMGVFLIVATLAFMSSGALRDARATHPGEPGPAQAGGSA